MCYKCWETFHIAADVSTARAAPENARVTKMPLHQDLPRHVPMGAQPLDPALLQDLKHNGIRKSRCVFGAHRRTAAVCLLALELETSTSNTSLPSHRAAPLLMAAGCRNVSSATLQSLNIPSRHACRMRAVSSVAARETCRSNTGDALA